MNKELYILIGISVFAFLIGQKIRAKIKPSANNKKAAKTRKSITRENPQQLLKKEKFKKLFLVIQLLLIFGLIVFMIPALTRDILVKGENYNQNLILRILIVTFALYILFTGILKINKYKKK